MRITTSWTTFTTRGRGGGRDDSPVSGRRVYNSVQISRTLAYELVWPYPMLSVMVRCSLALTLRSVSFARTDSISSSLCDVMSVLLARCIAAKSMSLSSNHCRSYSKPRAPCVSGPPPLPPSPPPPRVLPTSQARSAPRTVTIPLGAPLKISTVAKTKKQPFPLLTPSPGCQHGPSGLSQQSSV
jgi:hypothetical protein